MRWQRIVIGLGKSCHCPIDLSVASCEMKSYSEGRLELRNLQFLKKMLEKSSERFLSSDQPSEPKSLDVTFENCRSYKIRSQNMRLRSTWRPFDLSFERKGASVTMKNCVLCGQWFSDQFEIVSKTPFSCDAVGRSLLWAALFLLLCCELDWNIGIRKQGYVFIWL